MKNNITNILLVVLIALCVGLYFKSSVHNYSVQGISSTSVTNNTARSYSITVAPATASATTTSLINTDATDRAITSSFAVCTAVGNSFTFTSGAALTSWLLQMSTSTVSGLGLQGNTNFAASLTLATTTAWMPYTASTTPGVTPSYFVWPSGIALNMTFNATNTAACTIGVTALSL